MLSIPAIKDWWRENEGDFVLGISVFLLVFMAFLAGRISIASKTASPIVIEVPDTVLQKQTELQKTNLMDLALPEAVSKAGNAKSGIPKEERRGEYVASKNGAYYYTADMYMATRISLKNRVWFDSQEEAQAKGFKPANGL